METAKRTVLVSLRRCQHRLSRTELQLSAEQCVSDALLLFAAAADVIVVVLLLLLIQMVMRLCTVVLKLMVMMVIAAAAILEVVVVLLVMLMLIIVRLSDKRTEQMRIVEVAAHFAIRVTGYCIFGHCRCCGSTLDGLLLLLLFGFYDHRRSGDDYRWWSR